ncbi:EamA domain [Sesbania bispinosa]|nr:EamA domain [Sesbania bispinosa]
MEIMKKGVWNVLHGLKPVLLMVGVQIAYAAVNVFYKLAINDGMSVKVATAYRLAFGSAFTVPLALISERNNRPKLTWRGKFISKPFLRGTGFNISNVCVRYLQPHSGHHLYLGHLLRVITILLNLSSSVKVLINIKQYNSSADRLLERLNLRAAAGKAKVFGTLIGIGGAMLLTFFKGVELDIWPFHINLLHPHHQHVAPLHAHSAAQLLGVLCSIGSCFSFALWFIIQAKMIKEYPSHYSSTALMSTMGAIQATVFGLCVERDLSQWKLGWNIRLLAVAYSGIVASGLVVIVTAWCIRMRGPLFVSVFNPLMLVLVAVAASLMLDENLYLGSLLGAVLIVCGLYMVLWGKSKEMKKIAQLVPSEITKEPEDIQVVVMSTVTPVDHDKCHHNNHSQTRNVDDHLSKNGEDDIHL